ncbi:head GIN domain-containing protein [Pollutibacter soli]|uniref:head GIN domain-containing protein n=1 Tax=Pollutibacter soli TaxID=3034157 RepID=UPI003013D763
MKRIIGLAMLCLVTGFVQAQEKNTINDPNARERKVGTFSGVSVSGSIELHITQDPSTRVLVSSSDADWTDKIETFLKNDVLYIRMKKDSDNWNWSGRNRRFRAYVSSPVIKSIESSGSGRTIIEGRINSEELEITSSGSGSIDGIIDVNKLSFEKSGSGQSRLSGRATYASIETSGSGSFVGPDLIVEKCSISTSGSGSVEVTVNKEIAASTSGSGNIRLHGEALISDISTSGSGRLKRMK